MAFLFYLGGFVVFDVRAPWGKAGSGAVPHPLICHAVDTALVAQELLGRMLGPGCRRELSQAFEGLGDADGWVAALVGLHDLGKLSPAFQALRVDLATRLLGPVGAVDVGRLPREKGAERSDTPHGVFTAVFLSDLLREWGASKAAAWQIGAALGGHHGIVPNVGEVRFARQRSGDSGPDYWMDWCRVFVDEYLRLLGLVSPTRLAWGKVQLGPGAVVGLAGLTSVSDWIASSLKPVEFAGEDVDLSVYPAVARQRVRSAVTRLDWSPWQPPQNTSFAYLFPKVKKIRPVQAVVEQVVGRLKGPGIVVIEAPTGDGKTKAGLQAAVSLMRRLDLIGLYVAMPTKATGRQARNEAQAMVDQFGEGLSVRLLHGSDDDQAAVERVLESGVAEPIEPVDVDRDGASDNRSVGRDLFTRKAGLIFPIGAGTVDQLLKAGIRSWHGFIRLAGLSGKVVIIDEIHAYDVYMSTLLDRLLSWLGWFGIPVIMLSATLPVARRRELVTAWRAGLLRLPPHRLPMSEKTAARHYPLVTWADADGHGCEPAAAFDLNADRVTRIEYVDDDQIVSWVLNKIAVGGSAAVIHNLPSRALATFEKLRNQIDKIPQGQRPELLVLHGGMESGKRRKNEKRIEEILGPDAKSEGRRKGLIVVGTQVLEQSLDYDVDVMVSDLAPMDSLIQRMGRLHRFRRRDEPPVLGVCGFTETGAAGPRFPLGVHNVYETAVLLRTCALLRGRGEIRTPDEVRDLIDAVYGADDAVRCPDGWQRRWAESTNRRHQRRDREQAEAKTLYLPMPRADLLAHELTRAPQASSRTRLNRGRR